MRSLTYGEVNISDIAMIIMSYAEEKPEFPCRIVIGTDSQNFGGFKMLIYSIAVVEIIFAVWSVYHNTKFAKLSSLEGLCFLLLGFLLAILLCVLETAYLFFVELDPWIVVLFALNLLDVFLRSSNISEFLSDTKRRKGYPASYSPIDTGKQLVIEELKSKRDTQKPNSKNE